MMVGPAVATMVWSIAPRRRPVMRPAIIRIKFLLGMVCVGASAEAAPECSAAAPAPVALFVDD
jgi:hypothetical protein